MGLKKLYKKFSYKNYDGEVAGLVTLSQSQIKEMQGMLLTICDEALGLCKEKGYCCILGGGTALGAIRHHGFIPWDDDVDLCIARKDYADFINEFRVRYGDKYWVHTPEDNPEFGIGIARIRKKGTRVKERMDLIDDSEAGLPVDIFIIENVYDNRVIRAVQGVLSIVVKACLSCRLYYRDHKLWKDINKYNKNNISFVQGVRLVIGFLCSFMSVERWTMLQSAVFSMCKEDCSEYVSIPQGGAHFFGEMARRSQFCQTTTMKFEGRDYPVCIGMDDYMKRLYGKDYMTVPPPEKREKHIIWEFDLGDV